MFATTVTEQDPMTVLHLDGELDMATCGDLQAVGVEALATRPERLVLDMSDLTFVDSSGLGIIISLFRRADSLSIPLVLANVPRRIAKVLQITGIDTIIETQPSISTHSCLR